MSDIPRSAAPPRFGFPLTLIRLVFAVLTLVAVVAQYAHRAHPTRFYTINYFSFFTNQSNLFATALLLYGVYLGFRRGSGVDSDPPGASAYALPGASAYAPPSASAYDLLRGAAVLYMTVTGIVFALLLSRSGQALPWANAVVHYIMPIVIVLDWLFDPPRRRLTRAKASRWLIFPLVYFAYTLIRGAIVDWYPYPFLNVDTYGYARVLGNGIGMLIAIVAVGAAALAAANRLSARWR